MRTVFFWTGIGIFAIAIVIFVFFFSKTPMNFEAEAKAEATKVFMKHWNACGDVYKSRFFRLETGEQRIFTTDRPLLMLVKGVQTSAIEPEWVGRVDFSFHAFSQPVLADGSLGEKEFVGSFNSEAEHFAPLWDVELEKTFAGEWKVLLDRQKLLLREPQILAWQFSKYFLPEPCDAKYGD